MSLTMNIFDGYVGSSPPTGGHMDERKPIAKSAMVEDERWEIALEKVLMQTSGIEVDLAILFASGEYVEHFPEIVRGVRRHTGASVLIGCSGQGIIGKGQELEDIPALSLLTLSLPGAVLRPVRFMQELIEKCLDPQDWYRELDVPLDDVNAWLVFADPFHMDCESLINGLAHAYNGLPMLGGLASSDVNERSTHVFLNDEVFDTGGVGLAIGGMYSILPLVSQGCEPIGEPWTITKVQETGLIETISNRSAYELLVDTFKSLSPAVQQRAQRNLLVGLAADEYVDSFRRVTFLIRSIFLVHLRPP